MEGSQAVDIAITREGYLLDDVTVLFGAGEIPGAANAAIGKMSMNSLLLSSLTDPAELHVFLPP